MQNWIIENGTALLGSELVNEDVLITDGVCASESGMNAIRLDASGYYVLPGIVDVHGDAFERCIQPRPNVYFDTEIALREADRQMVSNGITTAYHGLGISWEPGVRAIEASRRFVAQWLSLRSQLACDTHLNLRWEIYALDYAEEAMGWLKTFPGSVLSVNDHTTLFAGLEATHPRITRFAGRMGMEPEACHALLQQLFARKAEVPALIEKTCAEARANNIRIFAHDETSSEQRCGNRKLGMSVSEFPMTEDAARDAISNNEYVIMGGPNVVRGGSQNNAMCATEAVKKGLCNVIASDYYYPAQLLAAFKLHEIEELEFAKSWGLVSANAAGAVGLDDRGTLEAGKRGDVIVVDPETKTVKAVFVAGKLAYKTEI